MSKRRKPTVIESSHFLARIMLALRGTYTVTNHINLHKPSEYIDPKPQNGTRNHLKKSGSRS